MIKRFRRRFILITMLSLLAVLFAIIVPINVFNIVRANKQIDAVTQLIVEGGGSLSKHKEPQKNKQRPWLLPDSKREISFSTRYCVVRLNEDKEIESVNLDNITSIDETAAKEYTVMALSERGDTGWLSGYKYRLAAVRGGYLLVLVDASVTQEYIVAVLGISFVIGLAAYLLVFLLVGVFSRRAIRPFAESYMKQKEFITNASHELKTPLTVISADAEILALNYGENEWCKSIGKQTAKMRSLIGEMISLSRVDEEVTVTEKRLFDLSEAVYDTAAAFEAVAERGGKRFQTDIDAGVTLTGDEAAIRQLISILLDNAVKYCDENGGITVSLKKGKSIVLSVQNTFADAEKLPFDKLFERFYRAESTRSISGYGLGLPIAKAIAGAHKALIRAKDAGCAVRFEIFF